MDIHIGMFLKHGQLGSPTYETYQAYEKVLILGITGLGILYHSSGFLVLELGRKSWVKGNSRCASWIVTLAPPTLWAQTNDFISGACFTISQFLFLFFHIQRYMSSEALGTLHHKSGTNPRGRKSEGDKYLVRNSMFLHTLCIRFYS